MIDDAFSSQWPLPDTERCLTKHLEHSFDFSLCLVKNPHGCVHARRFASSVFCQHPDRRSFETTDTP